MRTIAGILCGTLAILIVTAAPPAVTGPKNGSLVIVGGGKVGREIAERFTQLAGGPSSPLVIIPTAGEAETYSTPALLEGFLGQAGFTDVAVLHTRDRAVADTDAFAAPLKRARAVWIAGGRQWRLVDSYLGTAVEREIKALLARGGVVGGSSAGATIIGSYLVRGAREGNTVMMAKGYEQGFGLLGPVAIDQHLLTRKRVEDLVPVIEAHPDVLGIGLDEGTAIVVHGAEFEVIGESKAAIYDGISHDGKKYFFLSAGDRFDLASGHRK